MLFRSFDPEMLSDFNNTQLKIVQNALPHLKKGGMLFYITCSVFKSENENLVNEIVHQNQLNCLESHYIKGYEKNADTMFVALLTK